jgi:hypothetical protein
MTQRSCGTTTLDVDERCAFTCGCTPKDGCHWTVSCPDGSDGWIYTSGTGHTTTPPNHSTLTVAGELAAVANCLRRMWKRDVTAPEQLARRKVERTLKGTHEEIAHELGLRLRRRDVSIEG